MCCCLSYLSLDLFVRFVWGVVRDVIKFVCFCVLLCVCVSLSVLIRAVVFAGFDCD